MNQNYRFTRERVMKYSKQKTMQKMSTQRKCCGERSLELNIQSILLENCVNSIIT